MTLSLKTPSQARCKSGTATKGLRGGGWAPASLSWGWGLGSHPLSLGGLLERQHCYCNNPRL